MRIATILAVALLGTTSLAGGEPAQAAIQHYQLNIPRQSLDAALKDLAQQTGLQIGRFSARVDGSATVGPVLGDQTPAQALKTLLKNTGLEYKIVSDTTIAVYNPKDAPSTQFNSPLHDSEKGAGGEVSSGSDGGSNSKEVGKKISQDFRVAQVDQGKSSGATPVGQQSSTSQDNSKSRSGGLEEIIVTAQKKSERLQDVPIPVTAISADTLVDSNQLRLQDYYTSIPGLNLTAGGTTGAFAFLTIRGIAPTGGNPTVGITVDDVPYGSSQGLEEGSLVPDIDPSDLARVEVLRGPQGTLYGASSMGGLLKYVTVDPSTDGVTGRIQAGTSSVYNGAELGYSVRGSVNVPLSDTFAIRASGFTRLDPGYIDNVETGGGRGVNREDVDGGRLSALWRPSQDLSLKVSALVQHATANGSPLVYLNAGLGDLEQSAFRDTGGYDKTIQAYSATLTAKLGVADLTAVGGYTVNQFSDSVDDTGTWGPYTETLFGVAAAPYFEHSKTDKYSQEIRLSIPIGPRLDWLIGTFYTHEDSSFDEDALAANPDTGAFAGALFHYSGPATFKEYAAFTDLTLHATDRLDVQIGGRESQNRQAYSDVTAGSLVSFFYGVPSLVQTESDAQANAFTYLVTPRFKVSPDLMVYARMASGYRPGGPNFLTFPYQPDKTQNYELGFKGDSLDHKLSFDVSWYYIDWKDIQLGFYDVRRGSYTGNGSRARSSGAEFSVESRPRAGLTIAAWAAWDDAVLTEAFPPGVANYGVSGDRLPYSSRFSGNLSLEQDFPLWSGVRGFVGGSESYVGDRLGDFTSTARRQDFPDYARMDARAGILYGTWTANFFLNNVADKRGLISGGLGTSNPVAFVYIQPRTVGLSLSKAF